MVSDDSKSFLANQFKWILISLGISFAISMVVPFPYSLMIIIPTFMGMSYVIRRRAMQKAGLTSAGGGLFGGTAIDYYCMACGHKHRKAACPKCGSKMKKAGF